MALGRARVAEFTALVLLIAFALGLGGCSPIETYRSLTGISQNDPDPKTSPFVHNMAAAYHQPYPNLASVPPPPSSETSTAERDKLAHSLIADRTALATGGQPPSVAKEPPLAAAAAFAKPPPLPADLAALAAQPTATLAPEAAPARPKLAKAEAGGHKPGAAHGVVHEAPPQDSTLQSPLIPGPLPQPEAARPAPPVPGLAARPAPPTPGLAAAALASATPAPPPQVPVLAPPAPPPVKTAAPAVPGAVTVATLDLALRRGAAAGSERAVIERAAARYKKAPGVMHVVAYAAVPPPGGDPLASYRAALDRAEEVAKALAKAGIPAKKIQTEASPADGSSAGGRIEIRLAP